MTDERREAFDKFCREEKDSWLVNTVDLEQLFWLWCSALESQNSEPVGDINDEDVLRISKSGYSIKIGWKEKRIIACAPNNLCTEQWLEDAQRLCDGWNKLYTHPSSNHVGDANDMMTDEQQEYLCETLVDNALHAQTPIEMKGIIETALYHPSSNDVIDFNHLKWIYNRMIKVHNEKPNCDYMIKFKESIDQAMLENKP